MRRAQYLLRLAFIGRANRRWQSETPLQCDQASLAIKRSNPHKLNNRTVLRFLPQLYGHRWGEIGEWLQCHCQTLIAIRNRFLKIFFFDWLTDLASVGTINLQEAHKTHQVVTELTKVPQWVSGSKCASNIRKHFSAIRTFPSFW